MMTFSGRIMGGEKLDALRLTFYTSPVVLAILAPVALTTEWSKMIRRLGQPAPLEDADGSGTFVTGTTLLQLVLLGCFNAVAYNWVHNKVIAATSATTTTVLGNVKVAMLVLFSRILFGGDQGLVVGDGGGGRASRWPGSRCTRSRNSGRCVEPPPRLKSDARLSRVRRGRPAETTKPSTLAALFRGTNDPRRTTAVDATCDATYHIFCDDSKRHASLRR